MTYSSKLYPSVTLQISHENHSTYMANIFRGDKLIHTYPFDVRSLVDKRIKRPAVKYFSLNYMIQRALVIRFNKYFGEPVQLSDMVELKDDVLILFKDGVEFGTVYFSELFQ